ncbi:hypothetical protein [Aliagarivorans marinus]|uniref:hypothetical protein n=1 Tax=Aliagarivorans marinus TaxID=561965 RepID=UPI000478B0AE|nr:hypothetical protein [Aliagarivorans marinus]
MIDTTVYGVGLAKHVIQLCAVANQQELSNVEVKPREFGSWLESSSPLKVLYDACAVFNNRRER